MEFAWTAFHYANYLINLNEMFALDACLSKSKKDK